MSGLQPRKGPALASAHSADSQSNSLDTHMQLNCRGLALGEAERQTDSQVADIEVVHACLSGRRGQKHRFR